MPSDVIVAASKKDSYYQFSTAQSYALGQKMQQKRKKLNSSCQTLYTTRLLWNFSISYRQQSNMSIKKLIENTIEDKYI